MAIFRGPGKCAANMHREQRIFRVSYIPRGREELESQTPEDEIIEANSKYEAWAKAFRNFEKKYPVKDFQYFDLDIRMLTK